MTRRFDLDYRRHVEPGIARMMLAHATLVRLELEGFAEAYDRVMGFAAARGALHLSPELLAELEDWIATGLLAAVDAAPDPAVLTQAQLVRILGELR